MDKPWLNEPNLVAWEHAGLRCRILRDSQMLYLCGYVEVPPGHPWNNQLAYEIGSEVEVHGGLTYSRDYLRIEEETPPGYWWLGFDCSHAWDLNPGMIGLRSELSLEMCDQVYRDVTYTMAEVNKLAEQAKARWETPALLKDIDNWQKKICELHKLIAQANKRIDKLRHEPEE